MAIPARPPDPRRPRGASSWRILPSVIALATGAWLGSYAILRSEGQIVEMLDRPLTLVEADLLFMDRPGAMARLRERVYAPLMAAEEWCRSH